MEIFVDGGLFELLIAVVFGYAINFIFRRKFLLIGYSFIVVLAPVISLFVQKGELFYFLSIITITSSIMLVILLWKHRNHSAEQKNLFDVDKYWHMVSNKFYKRRRRKHVNHV